MYTVYVLKSKKDGKNYYGFTRDLEKRLMEHNNGKVTATRNRTLFIVVYGEQVSDLLSAVKREKYFKSGFGRKYVKNKLKMALSSIG